MEIRKALEAAFRPSGFQLVPGRWRYKDYNPFIRRVTQDVGAYIIFKDYRRHDRNIELDLWISPINTPDGVMTTWNLGTHIQLFDQPEITQAQIAALGRDLARYAQLFPALAKVAKDQMDTPPRFQTKGITFYLAGRALVELGRQRLSDDLWRNTVVTAMLYELGKMDDKQLRAFFADLLERELPDALDGLFPSAPAGVAEAYFSQIIRTQMLFGGWQYAV